MGPPPAEFWAPPVYPMIPGLSEIRTSTGNLVGNPEIPNTREFGILEIGDFPESSFTGSGHLIKNSGSCDETRRNSSRFPYMYESSSLHELAILCSYANSIVYALVSVCSAPNDSVCSAKLDRGSLGIPRKSEFADVSERTLSTRIL